MHADRILAPPFAHTMGQLPEAQLFDAHTHIVDPVAEGERALDAGALGINAAPGPTWRSSPSATARFPGIHLLVIAAGLARTPDVPAPAPA